MNINNIDTKSLSENMLFKALTINMQYIFYDNHFKPIGTIKDYSKLYYLVIQLNKKLSPPPTCVYIPQNTVLTITFPKELCCHMNIVGKPYIYDGHENTACLKHIFDDCKLCLTIHPSMELDRDSICIPIKFRCSIKTEKESICNIAYSKSFVYDSSCNCSHGNKKVCVINHTRCITLTKCHPCPPKPPCPRPCPSHPQAISDMIESVALEQTALSHVLNAEGEKIQHAIKNCVSIDKLLEINASVKSTIDSVLMLEMILLHKLELFKPCLCPK